jgi:hypothetical protein
MTQIISKIFSILVIVSGPFIAAYAGAQLLDGF